MTTTHISFDLQSQIWRCEKSYEIVRPTNFDRSTAANNAFLQCHLSPIVCLKYDREIFGPPVWTVRVDGAAGRSQPH